MSTDPTETSNLTVSPVGTMHGIKVKELEIRTRSTLFYGGAVFSLISIVSIVILFYVLIHAKSGRIPGVLPRGSDNIIVIFDHYATEIIMLITFFVSSLLAFFSFKAAGSIVRKVIPETDKELLSELIRKDEQGIDQYIRLSSLSGTTGFFTKLGLTGLPLATIGLTIFFTLLALYSKGDNFNDLAKLTLGVFLGSYVQKGVNPIFKVKKSDTDLTT